jgi:hypothetical protein
MNLDIDIDIARALDIVLARTRNRARALDLALSLAIVLARAIAQDKAQAQALAQTITPLRLNIVLLEDYALRNKIDPQDMETLRCYFTGNLLILNCLETGCYATQAVREKMIHELFLVA